MHVNSNPIITYNVLLQIRIPKCNQYISWYIEQASQSLQFCDLSIKPHIYSNYSLKCGEWSKNNLLFIRKIIVLFNMTMVCLFVVFGKKCTDFSIWLDNYKKVCFDASCILILWINEHTQLDVKHNKCESLLVWKGFFAH